MLKGIARYFHFDELGTNYRTECLAGLTTFVSMVYILFVNPNVMSASGMDKGAAFTATALATALGCFLMGVIANYPIALSTSLGMNAFFAYSVCIGMHVPWQTALAGTLIASLIFLVLTAFKIREVIIDAIPSDLKSAIAGGIGLFIAFLGLNQGGLIVADKSTLVTLGSFHVGSTWLTIFGLFVAIVLMSARVPAAIFISMVATTILGMCTHLIALPSHIVAGIPSIKPVFLAGVSHIGEINSVQLWIVVFTFLLVTFFDTTGTLVGLAKQAGLIRDNKIPRIGRALGADSLTTVGGSLLGASPMGAFVESSAGIAVGGRSGFTAIITGILFILGTFFSPLLGVITDQVTAPALIIIGILMANSLKDIHWDKFEIAAPSFIIVLGMPLSYSISDGIALGFVIYPISMLAAKRGKDVHPLMYTLAVVFVIFFWLLNN